MANIFHGAEAVNQVELAEGPLSPIERVIVEEEGYADAPYEDTKGIITTGVGQTGEYSSMSVKEAIADKTQQTRNLIPAFDSLDVDTQAQLVSAMYRGDLGQSPKAVALFNQGNYAEAADEFLNNEEYRTTQHPAIQRRMERNANAMRNAGAPMEAAAEFNLMNNPEIAPITSQTTVPTTGDKKMVELETRNAEKMAQMAETSHNNKLKAAGMTTEQFSALDQTFEEYVASGDTMEAASRATFYLEAERTREELTAAINAPEDKVIFDDLDNPLHFAGNTALSTLNTIGNIFGGLASMPSEISAGLLLSSVSDEEMAMYTQLQGRAEDLWTDEERKWYQDNRRAVANIQRAETQLTASGNLSDITGALAPYVNQELTEDFRAEGKSIFDDAVAGESSAGEVFARLTDLFTDNPGALAQATVESLPYWFAIAYSMPMTFASGWANNQQEAVTAFETANGTLPTDSDLAKVTALTFTQALMDLAGDRLVTGGAANLKKTAAAITGKEVVAKGVLAATGRAAVSAAGDFGAEGGADALGQLAATAGEGDVDFGESFGAGLLGAGSSAMTSGVIDTPQVLASVGKATANTSKKAVDTAKEVKTGVNYSKAIKANDPTALPEQGAKGYDAKQDAEARTSMLESGKLEESVAKENYSQIIKDANTRIKEFQALKAKIDAGDTSVQAEAVALRKEIAAIAPIIKRAKASRAPKNVQAQATNLATAKTNNSNTQAAVNTVLGSMSQDPQAIPVETVKQILDNKYIKLTAFQRARMNANLTTRSAEVSLDEVSREIIQGSEANMGVRQYVADVLAAAEIGDTNTVNTLITGLRSFRTSQVAKLNREGNTANFTKNVTKEIRYMDAALNEMRIAIGDSNVSDTTDTTVATDDVVANDVREVTENDSNITSDTTNSDSDSVPVPSEGVAEQQASAPSEAQVAEGTTPTTTTTLSPLAQSLPEPIQLPDDAEISQSDLHVDTLIEEAQVLLAEGTTYDQTIEAVRERFGDETANFVADGLDSEQAVNQGTLSEQLTRSITQAPEETAYSVDLDAVDNVNTRLENVITSAGLAQSSPHLKDAMDGVKAAIRSGATVAAAVKEIVPAYTGKPVKRMNTSIRKLQADINRVPTNVDSGMTATERKSWLQQVNWVKEFFAPTNPDNILQTNGSIFDQASSQRQVEEYIDRPLTDGELEQYMDYQTRRKSLLTALDEVFSAEGYTDNYALGETYTLDGKTVKKAPKYNDMMQYLAEDGELPTGVKEAVVAAAYNWVATTANDTLYNEDSAMNSIIGETNSDAHVHRDVRNILQGKGTTRTTVLQSLGKDVLGIIGISGTRNAPGNVDTALETSLGQFTLEVMKQAGVVKQDRLSTEETKTLNRFSKDSDGVSPNIRFIKAAVGKDGKLHNKLDQVTQHMKDARVSARETGTPAAWTQMFGITSRQVFPEFEKPTSVATKVTGTNRNVPRKTQEVLTKHNTREHFLKGDLTAMAQTMSETAHEAFMGLLGVRDPETVHVSRREAQKAENRNIERVWGNFDEFYRQNLEVGLDQPHYYTHNVWKNGRFGIAQNMVNPQGDKNHRAFIKQKGWDVELDPNNIEQMKQFWAAMDEELGFDNRNDMPKHIQEAANIARGFLETDTFEDGDIETLSQIIRTELGGATNTAMLKLDAIMHIARHDIAVDTNETFQSEMFMEIDGKTNGIIISLIQYGAAATGIDLLKLVGMGGLYGEGEVRNFNDFKKAGNLDAYNKLAKDWIKNLREAYTGADVTAMFKLYGLIDEKGNAIPKQERNLAKNPLMVIFYSSGEKAVKQSLGSAFTETVMDKLEAAGQAGDLQAYNALRNDLNTIVAGALPAVTQASQILETDLSNATLAKLEQKVGEVFGATAYAEVQNQYPEYMTRRDQVRDVFDSMYRRHAVLREKLIEARKAQLVEQGQLTNVEDMAKHEYRAIDERIAAIGPHFNSHATKGGDVTESIDPSKTKTEVDSKTRVQAKYGNQTKKVPSEGIRRVPAAPGVGAGPMGIHSADASIMLETYDNDIDSIGVHDANLIGITDAKKLGQVQNKAFETVTRETSVMVEALKAFRNSDQTYAAIIKEEGLNRAELDNAVTQLDKPIEAATIRSRVTDLVASAKEADKVKDDMWKNTRYVHQYADHNGVSVHESNTKTWERFQYVKSGDAKRLVTQAVDEVVTESISNGGATLRSKALGLTRPAAQKEVTQPSLRDQLRSNRNVNLSLENGTLRTAANALADVIRQHGNRSELGSLASVLQRSVGNMTIPTSISNAERVVEYFAKEAESRNIKLRTPTVRQQRLYTEALGSSASINFTEASDVGNYDNSVDVDLTNVSDVFESLPATGGKIENTAHKETLRNMVFNLTNKLTEPFGFHMRETEDAPNYGVATQSDIFLTTLANGAPETSGILAQGIRMSPEEIMAHELNHLVFMEGFKTDSRYRRQFERIFDAVKAKATPDVFLDNPATATAAEREGAQRHFDYIFNNKDGNNLEEFGAFATTNEKLIDFVNTVNIKPEKWFEGDGAYEIMSNILSRIVDSFNSRILNLRDVSNDKKLFALMDAMNGISGKKQNGIIQAAQSAAALGQMAMQAPSAMIEGAARKLANVPTFKDSRFATVRVLSEAVRKGNTGRDLNQAMLTHLNTMRDIATEGKYGWFQSTADEMIGRTIDTAVFRDMQRTSNVTLDMARKRAKDAMTKHVQNAFKTPVQEHEWNAMNKILVKLDIDSISDVGFEKLQQLITDEAALDTEIAGLEQLLKTFNNYNFYRRHAENLGYFMNTGRSMEDVALLNAHNISKGYGDAKMNVSDAQAARVEPIIDRLATLYGIKHADAVNLNAVADLLQRDPEGVNAVIDAHHTLKEGSKAQFASTQEQKTLSMKGWTKEEYNAATGIEVATLDRKEELEAQGYIIQKDPIPRDSKDPVQDDMYIFVAPDGALAPYMAQIASLTSNVAKGSDTVKVESQYGADNPYDSGLVDIGIINKGKEASQAQVHLNPVSPGPSGNKMIPIISPKTGKVTGWRYMMTEANRDELLQKENNVANVLGAMAGNVVDKVKTQEVNKDLVVAAKAQYDADVAKGRGRAYVEISEESEGKHLEIWRRMPTEMQNEVIKAFGTPRMMVRSDLVDQMFGYRKPSVIELFDKDPAARRYWEHLVVKILETVFPKETVQKVRKAENILQALVQETKDIIVVRSIVVPLFNVFSNTMFLMLQGINPVSAIKGQVEAYVAGNRLVADIRKHDQLTIELSRKSNNATTRTRLQGEIAAVKRRIEINPTNASYQAGLMPSVVDDAAADVNVSNSLRGQTQRKVSAAIDKKFGRMPALVPDAIKGVLGLPDSTAYLAMNNFVRNSDFIARHVVANHWAKQQAKEQGRAVTPEQMNEHYAEAVELFVNFDAPTHRGTQYSNDIGIAWFTKYLFRVNRGVARTFLKNPVKVSLAMLGMDSAGFDAMADTPIGSAMVAGRNPLTALGNPISSAIGALSLTVPGQVIS
ncbi:virion RNA polymerase [Vibrio phage 1.097.O._10N.286.49.B3]|uniref:Coil containing protein n=1 Tax=Vibrio phage 1.097.O._10N.286.49.B3 TaxID=1881383 RepID=A0A2I7R0M3_9CAUD|nr:virion RNA polymerase [Vibrio phage 1.097.O._10N.286.49.B3]AUR87175.1 coil containing protein [Vibrio phage 1.097.O._10N.286.49.B3]